MEHEDKLQLILETIVNYKSFIVISHNELREAISDKITESTSDLTDELIQLGYIMSDTAAKNGSFVSGFKAREQGKAFVKKGGFKKQRLLNNLKLYGNIFVGIIAVIGTIAAIRSCDIGEQQLKQSLQQDSLNLHSAESLNKSASSTIN